MTDPILLFLTDRGERQQEWARKALPSGLQVIIKRRPPEAELLGLLPSVSFIVTERTEPVTGVMITAAKNLKLILRLGSLTVGIDVEAARSRGVPVSVQPILGIMYIAEHVLMMTLATTKHLGRSLWQANTADHGKPPHRTDEDTFAFNWLGINDIGGLVGKSIAILGMGEIGVEFARRIGGFRPAVVLYNKRTRYPVAVETELGLTYADQPECVRRADVLITLLPYSAETDRSLNAATFAAMRRGAILVHAGSGSVIDEAALIDALQSGQLAGAALDTYEYEPLQPDHPLVAAARNPRSNLLLTPHVAAATNLPDNRAEDFAEIVRYLNGDPLQHVVA